MNEKYILRGTAIAARTLGDETIIMSATDSTLFSLSEVGSLIWQSADGRTPLSEIVTGKICEEFDVPPQTAYEDALAFVEGLSQHGILRVLDHPVSEANATGAENS
jgi:Coenzyme PQQ synthesis protein D (PqqD)